MAGGWFREHLSKKSRADVDKAMSVAAVLHPLTALPQVYEIFSKQDAASVSLMTWLLFSLIGLVFLAYGLLHRIKPLITTQVIWFGVDSLIIIGILMYS